MGLVLSALIAALASVAPNIFGWLTVPFWLLPAAFNMGAHDVGWLLFAVSGTVSYGTLSFVASVLCKRYSLKR